MKWIGGVILLIITIILLVMAIFMFPWFTTKTTYTREVINDVSPDYWDENLGGAEREWDESNFYLQEYELKSSSAWDWGENASEPTKSTGMLPYNSKPTAGGWDGSYRSIIDAKYPKPGFLAGGTEQLNVYNFTYYMVIFSIILSIVCIILITLTGFNKIGAIVPKVVVVVTIIVIILAPLYLALGLPPAIETDNSELHKVADPLGTTNTTYRKPAEAGGIMGKANEKDDTTGRTTATTDFAPGIGWWLAIGAIFTTIITIAFIGGKPKNEQEAGLPDHLRRKYHEFDQPSERGQEHYKDDQYGTPRGRDSYDNGYGRAPERYPDHGRSRTSPTEYHRPPPPPRDDYYRPPPRPPRRRTNYPPQTPRRGRRPPEY